MIELQESPLGKASHYDGGYDPGLLFPIRRETNRAAIGITQTLPFVGCDWWTAWELSWLDPRGKPHVAIARIRIDAASPHIIESKSLKLYLNGFAQTPIADESALVALLTRDLGAACGAAVRVDIVQPLAFAGEHIIAPAGECIDDLDIAIDHYGPPRADFLHTHPEVAEEVLHSQLLKSNCPVTGQPDWASVSIHYRGPRIDREGLLRYLISFRNHSEFHEHCVERIHVDLMQHCQPDYLDVYARYTRRGGIDINPWRSSRRTDPHETLREARQ